MQNQGFPLDLQKSKLLSIRRFDFCKFPISDPFSLVFRSYIAIYNYQPSSMVPVHFEFVVSSFEARLSDIWSDGPEIFL